MTSHALPSRRELQARARHESARVHARGRHVSGRGEGFGRLLTWTTLGAMVPGLGFLAAGRRALGALCLGLIALTIGALAYLYATGRLIDLGLQVAVRPSALLVLALLAIVAGLVWAAVIVSGHRSLRRVPLCAGQNVLSFALVAALVVAVLVPAATVAQYSLAQRSVVLNVFSDTGDRDGNLAAPGTGGDPWATTPRVNVLLVGSDAGHDREGVRPDTLIVASIDTQSGDTVLFNLPRNLQNVPFPKGTPGATEWPRGFNCGDECLLNAVWDWAERNRNLFPGDPQPGLTATRQVVSETLGLQIDYYGLVNMQGFVDLVDAMGGLEINVSQRVPIGITGRRPLGYIEPGRRVLNGFDTLWFAKSRADSDNYARMQRQQCVLGAASEQLDPVSLARAFPQLAASAERNVETDIPPDHLDAFVTLAQRVQGGSIRSLPFTNDVITPSSPDFAAMRSIVAAALQPAPPVPAATTALATGGTAAVTPSPTAMDPASPPAVEPEQAQDLQQLCG